MQRINAQAKAALQIEETIASDKILSDLLEQISPPTPAPTTLPQHFDWRAQKRVTPARQQGSCGSCWIFASLGAFESAYLIANPDAEASKLEVSQQEILDCSFSETNCVVGGFHDVVFTYLQLYGMVSSSLYPYNEQNPARGPYCNANFGSRDYFVRNWNYIDTGKFIPSVDALKKAILTRGPITSGVTAGHAWDADDIELVQTNPSTGKPEDIDHEVLIIGWDDHFKAKGRSPEGSWIIKNSWGPEWGKDGFAYVPFYGDNIGFGASWVSAMPDDRSIAVAATKVLSDARSKIVDPTASFKALK